MSTETVLPLRRHKSRIITTVFYNRIPPIHIQCPHTTLRVMSVRSHHRFRQQHSQKHKRHLRPISASVRTSLLTTPSTTLTQAVKNAHIPRPAVFCPLASTPSLVFSHQTKTRRIWRQGHSFIRWKGL